MKCKIMTWDEFRGMCEMDAQKTLDYLKEMEV